MFVVPDGSLYRVNFDALADGEGYLVEHGWRVHLLDSEHDLAAVPAAAPYQSLLLVGSPDFGHLAPNARARSEEACSDGFAPLPGDDTRNRRRRHVVECGISESTPRF